MASETTVEPSRLDELKSLKTLLWASLLEAPADKRAPLAARLESVLTQIEALTPIKKAGDPIDEIAARRAARGGATSRLGHSEGSTG